MVNREEPSFGNIIFKNNGNKITGDIFVPYNVLGVNEDGFLVNDKISDICIFRHITAPLR